MATELGVAYLSVVASTGGLGKDIERQMGGVGVSSGKRLGGGVMGGFKAAIGPIAGVMAATMGIQAVGNFLRSANDEARESQKVNKVTAQIIKSTGKAAGMTAGQIGDLATAISNKTGVDDEAVQASANLLLTFKKVRNEAGKGANIFDRATAAAQDLAAAGFGDANSAAKMLGKALNDPERGMLALSRAGVTFTQEQKDQVKAMLKAGDTLGAQKLIMKEVESQVGGVAAATATATQKMGVKWSNFKEAIGTVFVIPAVDAIATKLSPVIDWMTAGIPKVQAFFKSFSGPASGAIAGIVTAFSPLGLVLKAVLPILPQIGAAFSQIGGQANSTLTPALMKIAPVVQQVVAALAGGLQQTIVALLPVLTQIASAVLPVVAQVLAAVVPVVLQLVQAFSASLPVLGQLVSALLPPIAQLISGVMTAVMPLVTAILGLVQAFMPIIGIVMQLVAALLPPLIAVINALIPPIVAVVAQLAQALVPVFDAVGELITALMPLISGLVGVIGTIIGAVVPVVAVIASALIPILGSVISWLAKVVAGIVSFVAKGIKLFASWGSGVLSAITKTMGQIATLPTRIAAVFAGAGKWLLDAGANLLKGLWQGVSGTTDWLLNQLGGMSDRLIKFVLSKFGVHSPSKVFAWIGSQLGAGLAKGITASTSGAVSAIGKMITLVNSAASKATGKAAKKQAKAAAKAVESILKAQQNAEKSGTLANIAAKREALADQLKSANDELASQLGNRDQLKSQISGNIVNEFDIAAASRRGAGGIASALSSLVAKARAFAGKLKALIQAGYPAGLVQEIAGLGTAGIKAADALLSASSTQRGSIISDYGSLVSWSDQAGMAVADQMYGVGIAAQQGLVAGLLAQDSALASAASQLVDRLTNEVSKRLGIKVGKAVAASAKSVSSGSLVSAQSASNQPITMNGQIIGWLKKMASGQAQIVLADESLNAQLAMA